MAEAFTFSKEAKRPSLVLLKQEAEKVSWFGEISILPNICSVGVISMSQIS